MEGLHLQGTGGCVVVILIMMIMSRDGGIPILRGRMR